jgi:MFS family permease
MLYPIMPLYLQSIQFSVVFIGVLEGVAEAIAGISKGYFGKLSDAKGLRVPFIRWGYGLSAISKPMMAVFTHPLWVLLARSTDRIGKGIRTGARDAMLSDEATPQTKARIFGFHRSMDTLGAVIGPVMALLFLYYKPGNYVMLILAIILTGILKDKKTKPIQTTPTRFLSFLQYWRTSPAAYRKLLIGLLLFTLCNSSDVFLLLKMKEAGISDTITISIYIFYNCIYALFAYPIGILADKIGMKKVLVSGIILFSIVYVSMAMMQSLGWFIIAFLLYGIYAAATEGIAKAWITNIAAKQDKATAIGTYTALQSICTLLASSITGIVWYRYGATAALSATAVIAFVAAMYIASLQQDKQIA